MRWTSRAGSGPGIAIQPVRGGRLAVASAVLTTAAVFGPYAQALLGTGQLPGIRTEQLAVYGTAIVVIPLFLPWIRPGRHTIGAALALSMTLVVALVGGIWPPFNNTQWSPDNVSAGLDNLTLPIVVLLVVQIWLISGDRHQLLVWVLRTLVVAMWINAALALLSTAVDLRPLLSAFWTSGDVDTSTAAKAATMGRLSGIVNQPAEAGMLYGIAVLGSFYLWKDRHLRLGASLVALTVGGAFTVSKIFLLAALPLAAWQLIRLSHGRAKRLTAAGSAVVLAVLAAQTGLLPEWKGLPVLQSLVHPQGDLVTFYSANRFGSSDSTLNSVADAVLHISPWFGAGVGGLRAPYDNAWIEAFVLAGLLGVASYSGLLLVLAHAWWRRRPVVPRELSALGGSLLILVAAGSLGLPVLTANRVATVVWLVIGLAILAEPTVTAGRSRPVGENGTADDSTEGDPPAAPDPAVTRQSALSPV